MNKAKQAPMNARPILMSAPMVRALLEGRKSQTRRIIKPQPEVDQGWEEEPGWALFWKDHENGFLPKELSRLCPYGKPGDLLWVRETWAARPDYDDLPPSECGDEGIWWKASLSACPQGYEACHGKWRPSIYMPRWASRLTLEITDVRVERLEDISTDDSVAEGIKRLQGGARVAYRNLWESINGPASWNANPWIWVLGFRVHRHNVDEFISGHKVA